MNYRKAAMRLLAVLALTGGVSSLYGITVKDLFIARVAVLSQSEKDLKTGARKGMLEVLVRISGTSSVAEHNLVRTALRTPEKYYNLYSYEAAGPGDEPDSRWLRLQFEVASITTLLSDAGFPVWGENRPGTLVWIAVQEQSARTILTDRSDNNLVRAFIREGQRRGVPLNFPLLDLDDAANITPAVIWGGFERQIEVASERYAPDAILSGLIYTGSDGEWYGRWNYRTDRRWEMFESVSLYPETLVAEILDLMANQLAEKYAVDSSLVDVYLRVTNVSRLDDYASLMQYLTELHPVTDVSVDYVGGDEILFRLRILGRQEQLVETIGLDDFLKPKEVPDQPSELRYTWVMGNRSAQR